MKSIQTMEAHYRMTKRVVFYEADPEDLDDLAKPIDVVGKCPMCNKVIMSSDDFYELQDEDLLGNPMPDIPESFCSEECIVLWKLSQ